MAEHKAKDKDEEEAPSYPAPAMTEADHKAAAKHAEEAAKQDAPQAALKFGEKPADRKD